jgi:hypothetical protein
MISRERLRPGAFRYCSRVGTARCAVRRRVQRRNIRCGAHVIEYPFSPLNAACDGAARRPYRHGGSFQLRLRRLAGAPRWQDVGLFMFIGLIYFWLSSAAEASTNLPSYYAHAAVLDANGVIAPWYHGLNGQLDERLNIAVNVYKRYPWVDRPKAVMAAPDFVYNSHWSIKPDGTILIPPTTDWMCGDLCARAWSIIKGLTAYYQYSGDPIGFIYIPRGLHP